MTKWNDDLKIAAMFMFVVLTMLAVLLVWFICAVIGLMIGGAAGFIIGGAVGGAISLLVCMEVWPALMEDIGKW